NTRNCHQKRDPHQPTIRTIDQDRDSHPHAQTDRQSLPFVPIDDGAHGCAPQRCARRVQTASACDPRPLAAMNDLFYRNYESELLFPRRLAQDCARPSPATASRLLLVLTRSLDANVERLIASFTFMTARSQQKLDDEFPELTEALLNVLYPHYLA